ncbi:MAG TPA: acetyl ornithine aminotransferase family protein [Nitrospirales bacterium]
MSTLHIRTTPPGPRARALLRRSSRHVAPSATQAYPLVVDRAAGCHVWDVDGNCYLDFTAGVAVSATGHGHKHVVGAITAQADRLVHFSFADFFYPSYVRLAERLAGLAPGRDSKQVYFCNSGTEATEAAIKLTRHATRRPYVLAFYNAFHGRTLGAVSLTASKAVQRRGFAPLLPGVFHAPYPDPYRSRAGDPAGECLHHIEDVLFRTVLPPEETAAIFIEPIQGEGGVIVPPDRFLTGLRRLCDRYGILLVDDEVQAGMGRTGKFFAIEHVGVVPDIICMAKALGGGLPLGAIIARKRVMSWEKGSHTSTFGGNPVACEAGLATIEVIEKEGLLRNAAEQGAYIQERLRSLQRRHRMIGDVRGRGLMIGVELVRNQRTKERAEAERDAVVLKAFQRGLLLLPCGRNSFRISPPLSITRHEVDEGLAVLEAVLP